MVKYFRQIDKGTITGKPLFTPIDPNTLLFKDKRKGLEEVNLIKEKIYGKIKGRTCTYGSKQKFYVE